MDKQTGLNRDDAYLVCSNCGQKKHEIEFHRNGAKKNGRDGQCKVCVSKKKRRSYRRQRAKMKRTCIKAVTSVESVVTNRLDDTAIDIFGSIFGECIKELLDAGKI